MDEFNNHVNLLRSLAWAFHKTTGIDWAELFSEATVAYFESLPKYNKRKKTKQSTWVYHCVQNALINFCKNERSHKFVHGIEDWFNNAISPPDVFEPIYITISNDVKEILMMILEQPGRYKQVRGRTMLGLIRKDLRNIKQWKYQRIWNAMQSLRAEIIPCEGIECGALVLLKLGQVV